jgi:Dolichyl-phosphate-mannose-protein mannosyltransferase
MRRDLFQKKAMYALSKLNLQVTRQDIRNSIGDIRNIIYNNVRMDWAVALLALICIAAIGPLVPRSTDNARLLAAYINDEPALTMALDAMTARPIGNPANFYNRAIGDPKGPGPEWSTLRYGGFHYYGGLYPGLGFIAYAPLKVLGAPVFPTAPIILRILSLAAAMLAIIALYNIGRSVGGRAVGFAAAAFLLTDANLRYYASIIHPDTLQLLLGLLCVVAAIRHAQDGKISSLIALGVLAGLSQGTKLGANWFVPVLLLTPWLGLSITSPTLMAPLQRLKPYLLRTVLLGAVAILFWILSTPYSVLGSYYLNSTFSVFGTVTAGSSFYENLAKQLAAYYLLFGPFLFWLFALALGWTTLLLVLGRLSRPLLITWLTIISQFLWYGYFNRFWVVTGYLLVAYSLLAVLAGVMIRDAFLAVRARFAPAAYAGLAAILTFCAVDLAQRMLALTNHTLQETMRDRSTVVQLDRWLKQNNVPREAHIVWDDIAYADPNEYPNSRMHGGLMRWRDLRNGGTAYPDYVILSSSIFHAPFWAGKIAAETRPRMDDFDLSLRLYRELLHETGPQGQAIAWISQIGTIKPDAHDASRFSHAPPAFTFGPVAAQVFASVHALYGQFSNFKRLIDLHRKPQLVSTGPELRIYRINRRDDTCPREQAFTDDNPADRAAFLAFDQTLSSWMSPRRGPTANGAFIGVDLGCRTDAGGDSIGIRWIDLARTPDSILVEVSDNGQDWRVAARHKPVFTPGQANGTVDKVKLDRATRARFWRVVAESVPEGRGFGVWDIVLPD